jgi:glycosyltransferase involved in cell wall biosynthesis
VSRPPVSAAIIVRDSAGTLGKCLASLAAFDEVVVYDNGSTDGTIELARSFPNVTLHAGPFLGFGPTKSRAVQLARNDWVLSIDADESVSPELMASIGAADLSSSQIVFAVLRRNFFMGREVRHSGWGDDWLLRLFNRTVTSFDDALVHEKVQPAAGGTVVRLQGPLLHDAVRDVSDFLAKVNRYSRMERRRPLTHLAPAVVFLSAAWSFFRTFVLRAGFLDGWRGLVIAVSDANGVFFKYMRVHAARELRER